MATFIFSPTTDGQERWVCHPNIETAVLSNQWLPDSLKDTKPFTSPELTLSCTQSSPAVCDGLMQAQDQRGAHILANLSCARLF